MSEQTEQPTLQTLAVYGEILYQMMGVDWFKEIVQTSFDIHRIVNEETKEIDIQVIEVPMEVRLKRMGEAQKAKADASPKIVAPNTSEVIKFNR